uniref:Uncharacterized protein n=1 Tax=Anguilla anguilla TaxID=7936 RepID=A0A0E9SFM5_ANGAN
MLLPRVCNRDCGYFSFSRCQC